MTGPQNRLITAAITILIGASCGAIVGYFISHDGTSWHYWINNPVSMGSAWWILFGALVGAGIDYVRRN